jgi:hypothetical protein
VKIGKLRAKYMIDAESKWNGIVRDVSAQLETSNEEISEFDFLEVLAMELRWLYACEALGTSKK